VCVCVCECVCVHVEYVQVMTCGGIQLCVCTKKEIPDFIYIKIPVHHDVWLIRGERAPSPLLWPV